MTDKIQDELMTVAMNQVEGPTLMNPRPPTPYMSCAGCRYYSKSMASSGGVRNAPTYHKSCTHPKANAELSIDRPSRSLTFGVLGESDHKTVTPEWCPYLKDNK